MPASRRGQRGKDTIEIRRARGEIACAECRRHKLKCNRAIPCSTCIRKGCEDICPNGTLSPAYGQVVRNNSRVSDLQTQRLTHMTKRIRQLEDALQIAHSAVSAITHPLLTDDLLKIKHLIDPPEVKTEEDASDEDTIDSIGTLAMLGRGIESYVGTDELTLNFYGSAEAIHFKMVDSGPPSPTFRPNETFPFKPLYLPAREIWVQIEEKLPSFERASALIEAYLENISWLVRIVDRAQIIEDLMPKVYRRRQVKNGSIPNEVHHTDPHMLALLLAVFACGAIADLTLPPMNEEANLYYHLAWTAISLRSVFDGSSIHTVQALGVLGIFDTFTCRKKSLEGTWKMISFCISLAASIGLHRDPAHFKLPPKQVQRRRQVFWEIHTMEVWKSIGSGRPMSLLPSFVDCELPEDTDVTVNEDGTTIPSVWAIRCHFLKDIMTEVVEKLGSVRSLKYSEILHLDQKIRNFGLEEAVIQAANNSIRDGSVRNTLTRFLLVLLKDASLLLLHRNFFVRALAENPTNPTQSHFAPSFLATYRSAVTILRALRELFQSSAHFIVRVWPVWAHALSASVMLGSVAACGTTSALAPQAFTEFNLSIELLEKVQMHSLVKDMMPTVLRLRDRAYQALTKHGNDVQIPQRLRSSHPHTTEDEKDRSVLSSTGRALQKGKEGRFGGSHSATLGYPEATDRSVTPPSERCSEASEVPYCSSEFLSHVHTPLTDGSYSSSSKCTQESLADNNTPHTPTHSTGAVSTPNLVDDTRELFQPSPQSIVTQHALENLRTVSISQGEFQPISDALSHGKQVQPQEHPTLQASTSERQRCDRGFGKPQHPHSDSSLETTGFSTLSNSAFPLDLGKDGQDEMQIDPSIFSFDFDSLPMLDTDFDVSFNMRASTGDESILPFIPDDLAACRSIFQDSRFFGNCDTTSDNEICGNI